MKVHALLRARWYLPLTGAVMAVAIAATSLAPTEPTAVQATSPPRLSAATLANGLLFGHGPAAKYLGSQQVARRPLNAATIKVEGRIDRELAAAPGAAAKFARDVQSGNPVDVRAGLGILGQAARATLASLYGNAATARVTTRAEAALRKAASEAQNGTALSIYLYNVNYEVNVNDALNVNVIDFALAGAIALIVVVFLICPPCAPSGGSGHVDGSQLVVNQFVGYVATHLRAAPGHPRLA